jgi:ADP-ribose pyrophosphatase YjhB (NUDIX family)
MKQTKSAGGVVLNNMREVLVVSQHGSAWSLPKGHIEKGEDPVAAARREIFEESGIKNITFVKELGSYQRHKMSRDGGEDTSELKTIYMFVFRTTQVDLHPHDRENPEARWVRKESVAALLTHRKDKEFYLKIMNEI